MRFLSGVAAWLRRTLRRREADLEMDEEIRFHIDMETERNVRRGMALREARRRALVAFGGVERHRDALRSARRVPVLEALFEDMRFGLRILSRERGLSTIVVLVVALGIGATTVVSSTASALVFRPLPLPQTERLVAIQELRDGMISTGTEGMLIPYDRYVAYRERGGSVFEALAAHRLEETFSLRLPDATVALNGALTSGNYFETLGVRPTVGRAYTADDAAEIVLSHELWLSHFGGDSAIVGRPTTLDGQLMIVVGVAPAWFGGATAVADQLWAPVGLRGTDRSGWSTRMVPIGRLAEGVSRERAAAQVYELAVAIPPEEGSRVRSARLEPLTPVPASVRAPVLGFLAMLQGMALLLLLIAAANIAGLMLARGFSRRREMAVRLAIGASRTRLIRHLLAEDLLLCAIGGIVGVGLAYLGTGWLGRLDLPPAVPDILVSLTPDGRVLAIAMLATLITGLLCGFVPALDASRPELVPALKTGGAASVGGHAGIRGVFVGCQVALAVTLLMIATLFARSLQAGLRADVGFDPIGVVAATINLGAPLDYDRERALAFHRDLEERILNLPGVEQAALARYVPLSMMSSGGGVRRADDNEADYVNARMTSVTPSFFETMGVDIVAGRGFDEGDSSEGPPIVIISQALADRLWPTRSPIGARLSGVIATNEPAEVVGVVEQGRYRTISDTDMPYVFQPYGRPYYASMAVLIRAPGVEETTLRGLADQVRAIDADVAVATPVRVTEYVQMGVYPQRIATQIVGAFGLVGLCLAALGIYGVMSYQARRRTREFGVRRALGATSAHIIWIVVRGGAIVAAAGCAVGMAVGSGVANSIRSFLFGIDPLDPVTFVAVPLILSLAAVAAGLTPAMRANAVEASESLKGE